MLKYGGLSRQVSGKLQEDALQHIISRYNHQQTIKIHRTVKKQRQSEEGRKKKIITNRKIPTNYTYSFDAS